MSTEAKGKVLNAAETRPWLKFYGKVPPTIPYPEKSLYERLMETVEKYPNAPAWDFMGTQQTYRQFADEVEAFASGLKAMGFEKGDIITISMPTAPHGVIPIYAVNKLGGICSMIHPLSPAPQIKMYLQISKSKWALTLNAFYKPFNEILHETDVKKLILAEIPDYLSGIIKPLFKLTKGRKIPPVPPDERVIWYRDILKSGKAAGKVETAKQSPDDTSIILYSGGTTGIPKGIELTNKNMIAEGMQVMYWGGLGPGQSVLAILPIFHGFGLGVCVNAAFMSGGLSILVPTFTPETVADLVKKKRPNYLIGVPTLFEALANNPKFQKSDLSCLKATFSGADTLPRQTKEKFESVVKNAGGQVKLMEGYGLTEAVTAIMAMPLDYYKEGSIGVPFPDMLAKIVKIDTTEEAPVGEEGEICIHGPAVMKGYLNNPEATAKTLKKHSDGRIWLHTGDIGYMDEDGFFFFKLRQKRMLKVSGVNVYPKVVEELLRKHPAVKDVCVIGVPDKHQISRVKAFVIPNDPAKATEETKKDILEFAGKHLLKWECPREIEFRNDLPKTLVGKIAFNELEKEELEKLKAKKQYPFDQ